MTDWTWVEKDLIRIGLAKKFKLARVFNPVQECKERNVSPEAMIELAKNTDLRGRDNRQRSLNL